MNPIITLVDQKWVKNSGCVRLNDQVSVTTVCEHVVNCKSNCPLSNLKKNSHNRPCGFTPLHVDLVSGRTPLLGHLQLLTPRRTNLDSSYTVQVVSVLNVTFWHRCCEFGFSNSRWPYVGQPPHSRGSHKEVLYFHCMIDKSSTLLLLLLLLPFRNNSNPMCKRNCEMLINLCTHWSSRLALVKHVICPVNTFLVM